MVYKILEFIIFSIIASAVSFLLFSFFIGIYMIIMKKKGSKSIKLSNTSPIPENLPVMIECRLNIDGFSYTASILNIEGRHLNLKNHENLVRVLEMILQSERDRHEFLKKLEKDKFKLLSFDRSDTD